MFRAVQIAARGPMLPQTCFVDCLSHLQLSGITCALAGDQQEGQVAPRESGCAAQAPSSAVLPTNLTSVSEVVCDSSKYEPF